MSFKKKYKIKLTTNKVDAGKYLHILDYFPFSMLLMSRGLMFCNFAFFFTRNVVPLKPLRTKVCQNIHTFSHQDALVH